MGRPINEKAVSLMSIYPRLKIHNKKDKEIAKEWGITYEALRYSKRLFRYENGGWKRDIDKLIQ